MSDACYDPNAWCAQPGVQDAANKALLDAYSNQKPIEPRKPHKVAADAFEAWMQRVDERLEALEKTQAHETSQLTTLFARVERLDEKKTQPVQRDAKVAELVRAARFAAVRLKDNQATGSERRMTAAELELALKPFEGA